MNLELKSLEFSSLSHMADVLEKYGYKAITLSTESNWFVTESGLQFRICEFEESGNYVFFLVLEGKELSIIGEYASYQQAYDSI